MSRLFSCILLLAVLCCAALPARAETLSVDLNQGKLIRLNGAADSVFVADPNIADVQVKSPSIIYVYGRKSGETTLFAVDDKDRILLNRTIIVSSSLGRLRSTLNAVLPNNRITVSAVDDSLLLSGLASSPSEADEAVRLTERFLGDSGTVINRLTINQSNQITLRVRVAEVSRDTIKQLGIDWTSMLGVGAFAFGLTTTNTTVAGQALFATLGNGNKITGGVRAGNLDLNGVIDALANAKLVSVLAEPNLTALSGETASFLAGGEFPIPIPQDQNTVTIQFKEFGVRLEFTPTILANDRISLKVAPEVSALSTAGAVQLGGFTVPSLTTRRAETAVELASGQSFAIAGLLQTDVQQGMANVPGISNVPILGRLFQSEAYRRNETELVIIVTPYLVQPAPSVNALKTANDHERAVPQPASQVRFRME